jgi:O-antigen/teichoic acid export membrane protein
MTRIALTTQVAILGFGRLLNMVAAAATLMVLARIMPDRESYGAVNQLLMLNLVFSQIFALGLPQSIYYFLPRYAGGEQKGFLLQIILMLMAAGGVLGLGLYFGAETLGRIFNTDSLSALLRAFALYPVFVLPILALEGTLLFFGRPVAIVVFSTIMRLGMFCALVFPTLLGMSLTRTVDIWVGTAGVLFAVALPVIFANLRGVPFVWRATMLRDTLAFSLPLSLVTLVGASVSYIDRFLVANQFGAAAYGVYANASMQLPTVTMIINATVVVMTAEFSRRASVGDYAGILPIWHRAAAKTALLIFATLGFCAFWGRETMVLLFSDRYADSGSLFSIAVWGIPLYLFTMRPLFIAHGALSMLIGLTLLDLVLVVAGMLLFGHWFGLSGMIFGVVLAGYLGAIPWVHCYVNRLTRIGWRAFMPWRTIAAALLFAVAAGAASRLVHLWLGNQWPLLAVYVTAGVLYLLLYFAVLYLTGLLDLLLPERYRPRWLPYLGRRPERTESESSVI